jgi:alpha-beta hydrolase superfamily lysophospholipase
LNRTIQLSFLVTLVVCSVTLAHSRKQRTSSMTPPEAEVVQAAAKSLMVARGNVRIEVIAQGSGPVIVILPSLGRGAEDYNVVAARLSADGFRVLRPQARGIGRSTGPMSNLTLHDYAADVSTVIEHERRGPVVVVRHAFGNFVARMLATDRTWCGA